MTKVQYLVIDTETLSGLLSLAEQGQEWRVLAAGGECAEIIRARALLRELEAEEIGEWY